MSNDDFSVVASLAKKESDGTIKGYWGLMSDFSRSFKPWGNNFKEGLYLAGVEVDPDIVAPPGWTKWIAPARTYLVIKVNPENYESSFKQMVYFRLAYEGYKLVGAAFDYTDNKTQQNYLYFPVEETRFQLNNKDRAMEKNLAEAKKAIKQARRIVFLGGAGVSTASGIPDFRSPQGIYNVHSKYGVPYEVMLSHSYFVEHTDTFYDFYWSSMPGIGVAEAMYDYVSALSGTGLDIINFFTYKANYPAAYPYLLWLLSLAMFLGRLEILPLYYALRRLTHRLRHPHHKNKAVKEA